jgi:hypothetical protein
VGIPHELLHVDVLDAPVVERREEVAHVEDADDVVERVAVDGIPGIGGVDHSCERLLRRQLDREGHHLGPRDHDLVDLRVREVEHLVDHLLLALLDHARLLCGGDDVADVLLRVGDDARRRGLDAEKSRERVRRLLQEPDERVGGDVDGLDRERDPQSRGLVLREGDGLRDELAERHVQVRDEGKGEEKRHAVRERLVDPPLDDRLAHSTEGDRERGDAELHGADEAHRAVHDAQGDAGAPAATTGELDETGPPRGDERVLGRDEEGVPQHEEENGEDLEEDGHAPSPGAWVLGGISSNSAAQYRDRSSRPEHALA